MITLSISGFFQTLDPTELMPEVGKFLTITKLLIVICMLIGPVLLLLSGLKYWKSPSKLPNHNTGFRTYFGMGSKLAWDYTQRLAGALFTIVGGVLLLGSLLVFIIFLGQDDVKFAFAGLICMIVQAALALLSWAVIVILATVNFDKNGKPRK